ncbi:diguanylate cyclase/phosphodiesterase (GGDEF & EAL domains) with PAS/PAC sensor [Collimonas arenae]|uniref:Diguanylate cyclase/phosphodiesterase (GGDEF & EAL domains) with PAS/PAC sensor n=1 Tax=Collimonas arenae TaxID=279058 RepID=A0A0A1FBS5_9BURK|nr:EAL domain-containing protein [Collimonas arenae]AIY42001.1 diguanylate cyclase/phosphodiesterase (GGDEF & EAL domains) with PAS/PAC sensor [Collimonas arenae]
MWLFHADTPKSLTKNLKPQDWAVFYFSVVLVPALVVVFTILAFATLDSRFGHNEPGSSPIHVLSDPKQRLLPEQAFQKLTGTSLQAYYNTQLQETPFWFSFVVSATPDSAVTELELPSRHAQQLSCWSDGGQRLLGTGSRYKVDGQIKAEKTGFVLSFSARSLPVEVLCKGVFSGPARISVRQWGSSDFAQSQKEFYRGIGLMEGGLLTLTLFVLVAALINREWMYVLFAVWLLGNLRLGANAMGWDAHWLIWTIPNQWLPWLRKLTFATYYIVTFTLFGRLFQNELKQIGFVFLQNVLRWLGAVLLVAAFFLSYQHFLPMLWCWTVAGILILIFLLARIVWKARTRAVLWYCASMFVVLFTRVDEVVAAAFGIKTLDEVPNNVIVALLSSLMASFAFAEQMRAGKRELAMVQAELRTTYDVTPIGLFTLSADGSFVRTNPALEKILGHDAGTQWLKKWDDYFEPGAHERLSKIVSGNGGNEAELHGIGGVDGKASTYLVTATFANGRIEGSLQDITDRSHAVERLRFLAEHDPLTGVLNRRGIEIMLEQAIERQCDDRPLALAYLDLDRFKLINDLFGHQSGDEVLKQLCERVQLSLGEGNHIGRIGGDEFIVLFQDVEISVATEICSAIIQRISYQSYHIGARAFHVKGSIGLIEVAAGMRVQDAISAADRACREAKKAHDEHIVVYHKNASVFRERMEELSLIERLGGEFLPPGLFVEMQPIMSLKEPEASLNFEVLLRLRDSDNKVVPATRVIAAAEENGSIAVIDRWVMTTVLEWLDQHQSQLPLTRFVCVNLSGASLNDEKFIQDLFLIMEKHLKVVPMLCIEVTESVALHDLEHTSRIIERLQALGAKVALDDFGAGYTSFTYLKSLSADALKIDGAFIQSMNKHPANEAIVEAIVELARNLGMKSIAEWVEDCAMIEALAKLGVDYVQGFIVAKPQSPDAILSARSAASFITDPDVARFVAERSNTDDGNADGESRLPINLH